MIMSLQQQQKDAAAANNNLQQNQRPPRSNRTIKTSQGTRARHSSKPLLTPTMAEQQRQQIQNGGAPQQQYDTTDILAYSDQQQNASATTNSGFDNNKYQTAGAYATSANLRPFQQQQRSFNNMFLSDFARKTNVTAAQAVPSRRISQHKTRKNQGQVTLFSQAAMRGLDSSYDGLKRRSSSKQKKGSRRPKSRSRSRSSQKSAGVQHNRSKADDSDCGTPSRSSKLGKLGATVGSETRKSLNQSKRTRDQNAISAENMRFVAKLINVKATVPSGQDLYKRDVHQKQLRKNLQVSSFNSASANTSSMRMIQQVNSSQMRRSLQGTPTQSTRSIERQKQLMRGSPKITTDSRLKSKGLQNFYKIKKQNSENKTASPEKSFGTPKHLKPRAFDPRVLAQMYEADDHLLFGDEFKQKTQKQNRQYKNKCSDTASHASSRSSQRSVRRRKKKAKRKLMAMMGETGSDTGYRQLGSNGGGLDEPIEEENSGATTAVGPRPNPTGHSLIQKMNDLMNQKQKRSSKGGQSKSGGKQQYHGSNNVGGVSSNLAEQVQQMLVTDQENYGREELQSLQTRNAAISEQPENDSGELIVSKNQATTAATQQKKPFVMKLSRSNPRHHSKRKSLQENIQNFGAQHPFAQNPIISMSGSQKAALLSGYYSSQANQMRSYSKPNVSQAKKQRSNNNTGNSLPPRNVKTATIRKTTTTNGHTDIQQTYCSYDYFMQHQNNNGGSNNNTTKASPIRSMNMRHSAYPRTTNNASSASAAAAASAARRRIIVAQNKSQVDYQELGTVVGASSNYSVLPKATYTDSGWNRCQRAANLTTVDDINQNPLQSELPSQEKGFNDSSGRPIRPGAPQSAHATTSQNAQQRQRVAQINQQQPLRAYQQHQDMRKKFLTEKLFSPVLNQASKQQSHAASSNAASQPFDPQSSFVDPIAAGGSEVQVLASEAESSPAAAKDHHPVIIQGSMRPARVTRTAEGTTRPRVNKQQTNDFYSSAKAAHPESSSPHEADQRANQQISTKINGVAVAQANNCSNSDTNLVPKILSTTSHQGKDVTASNKIGVLPIKSLIDSDSSFNDGGLKTKSKSNAQVFVDAPSVGGDAKKAHPQHLNIESADTFNHITSGHNIQEEGQRLSQGGEGDYDDEEMQDVKTTHQSAAMLFTAPKTFNQISEEGGDSSDDDKDVDDQAVVKESSEKKKEDGRQENVVNSKMPWQVKTNVNSDEDDGHKLIITDEGDQAEENRELQNESIAVLPKNYPRLI